MGKYSVELMADLEGTFNGDLRERALCRLHVTGLTKISKTIFF